MVFMSGPKVLCRIVASISVENFTSRDVSVEMNMLVKSVTYMVSRK
jgi:hypothetical protein